MRYDSFNTQVGDIEQSGEKLVGQVPAEVTECLLDLGQVGLDDDLDAYFLQGGKQRFPIRVFSKMNAAGPKMSTHQRAFHGVGQNCDRIHGTIRLRFDDFLNNDLLLPAVSEVMPIITDDLRVRLVVGKLLHCQP